MLALTPLTRKLIGRAELAAMERDAWLVNVARGGVVDTGALVDALRSGQIGGAALDVTDPEPLPDGHPLVGPAQLPDHAAYRRHRGDARTLPRAGSPRTSGGWPQGRSWSAGWIPASATDPAARRQGEDHSRGLFTDGDGAVVLFARAELGLGGAGGDDAVRDRGALPEDLAR